MADHTSDFERMAANPTYHVTVKSDPTRRSSSIGFWFCIPKSLNTKLTKHDVGSIASPDKWTQALIERIDPSFGSQDIHDRDLRTEFSEHVRASLQALLDQHDYDGVQVMTLSDILPEMKDPKLLDEVSDMFAKSYDPSKNGPASFMTFGPVEVFLELDVCGLISTERDPNDD